MLTLVDVDVFVQASHILRSVSLEVGARDVVCLVGRNGAGKTTTLRTIMGYLRPRAGRVELRGQPIHGRRTHEIARLGLGWAPEDCGIFADLTVAENIEIATWTRPGGRPAAERIELAYRVFPMLRRYAGRKGPQLSGGEPQMLSIARALALDPELLLLHAPFEAPSPAIIPAAGEGIAALTELGRSILIAESNIHHVPEDIRRLYVIERGAILFAGGLQDAWRDPSLTRIIGSAA